MSIFVSFDLDIYFHWVPRIRWPGTLRSFWWKLNENRLNSVVDVQRFFYCFSKWHMFTWKMKTKLRGILFAEREYIYQNPQTMELADALNRQVALGWKWSYPYHFRYSRWNGDFISIIGSWYIVQQMSLSACLNGCLPRLSMSLSACLYISLPVYLLACLSISIYMAVSP